MYKCDIENKKLINKSVKDIREAKEQTITTTQIDVLVNIMKSYNK